MVANANQLMVRCDRHLNIGRLAQGGRDRQSYLLNNCKKTHKHNTLSVLTTISLSLTILTAGITATKPPLAQSITGAPDGTNTNVNLHNNSYDISGGSLSSDGRNLFHSFSKFGLQPNEIANFLSQPTIQNILGRVTSGNASVIEGMIRVTGGNSNLYLMNPAGIIFGQGASLNVPASFTATTANGIGFGSNQWFSAAGNNDYTSLVGSPSSLAFTMKQPGAIVNAANLAVGQGQIWLVGGTVASAGKLTAAGGNIIVAAVPGTSLVRLTPPGSPLSLEIQPISASDSQPTAWTLPVLSLPRLLTGSGAGSATGLTVNRGTVQLTGSGIRVKNGDVVTADINTSVTATTSTPSTMTNAGSILLSAQRDINTTQGTLNSASNVGNGGSVKLNAVHDIAVNSINTQGNSDVIDYNSTVNGGAIALTSQTGKITTGTLDSHAFATYGSVNSGAIGLSANGNLTTNNLDSHAAAYTIGNAGAITLTTQKGKITTGTLDSHASGDEANGGKVTLTAQTGNITTATIDSHTSTQFNAKGGAVTLTTQTGNITTATIDSSASSEGGIDVSGGEITLTTRNGNITTDNLLSRSYAYAHATAGSINLSTLDGNITTGTLNSSAGSQVPSGGTITLTTGQGNITTSNISTGVPGARGGNGGAITLATQQGDIITGDLDTASNAAYFGNGGAIRITASNSITSGKINSSASPAYGDGGNYSPANGGSVTLNAGNDITLSSIKAQGGSNGTGGNVDIEASGLIKISDSFTARDGRTIASISTQGGTGGGQIKIVNGGGLENLFKVGDGTTNGTAKDITSGNYQISSTPVFTVPSPNYTQGNIQIITSP